MHVLTDDMQRLVTEQRLSYVATVCPDGTPNLSHKGTLRVLDGSRLAFADIRSPGTVRNLRSNPAVEINVVDIFLRKGYRFKGTATVLERGSAPFAEIMPMYRDIERAGERIRAIVLIEVAAASAITSPGYDLGTTEAEMRDRWQRYYASLDGGRRAPPASD